MGTPGMRGAPSVSLGLDAEPPEREPKEEDDGHGHHAEHERGACATAHGAPRLPHEPRARENTVEASAMISSGVDVTGPNTGCDYTSPYRRGYRRLTILSRARERRRGVSPAPRAMWNPIALAQANAVVARGVSVRWRDFKVGRVDPRSRARPVAPSRLVSLDRPLAHAPPRVHLSQATARDVFAPVYIVLLLVILKLLVGEESLPPSRSSPPCGPTAPRWTPGSPRAPCAGTTPRAPRSRRPSPTPPRTTPRWTRSCATSSPASRSPPRIPDPPPPSSSRGSTTPTNSSPFTALEPHRLYAGVLFPRLLDGEKTKTRRVSTSPSPCS